jgi:uncharacterized protein (DUF3820 family)
MLYYYENVDIFNLICVTPYKQFLIDLREYYVVWYHQKGFPKRKLGDMLKQVYELKLNGLEELIRNIKRQFFFGFSFNIW